jgi:hypothetical protein
MGTTFLAWLIIILGLLVIAGGIWDFVDLWKQRKLTEIPLRSWGTAIAAVLKALVVEKLGPPRHQGLCTGAPPEGGHGDTNGARKRYGLAGY